MQSLFNFFFQSLKDNPQCNALFVDNQAYTYEAVHTRILRFAKLIHQTGSKVEFIGLFAHKSIDAYAGLLSILKSGKAYLPLNPKFSEERNLSIIDLSGIDTLIVGKEELTKASVLLKSINKHINVIIDLERDQVPQELLNLPYLSFYFLSNGGLQNINAIYQSQWAYLLFTSGSTGVPKGVPISHDNVISYVNYLSDRYKPTVDDRFSQTFDLTFDLSVHDMFLCWANGATLYPIPDKSVMAPANFINKNKITFWFSVPSVAVFMSRFRMLKESAFLSLRYSLFCGEPLPLTLAEKWQKSAPNSIIENIYGPTEATIGISHYRWVKDIKNKSFNGIVSIGKIFSSQEYIIIDDNNKEVATGDLGELCLRGNQVFNGYLNDLEKTKEVFISLEGKPEQWYRTGDIVFTDESGNIYYCSRKDFQVQILGHRVELEEVNRCIRLMTSCDGVVTIPHPIVDGIAQGLCSFLNKECSYKPLEIINHCKKKLPEYMVPNKILYLDDFPYNSNGKVDRNKLRDLIENK